MAVPENQIYTNETSKGPIPITPVPQRPPAYGSTINDYTQRAARVLRTTKDSARAAYDRTRRQAVQTYSRAPDKAQDLAVRTRDRARQTKQEHPVQLLAVVFGVAVAAGIALRIWRAQAS